MRSTMVAALAMLAACFCCLLAPGCVGSVGGRDGDGGGGPDDGQADCAAALPHVTGRIYYYCECAPGAATGCAEGDDGAEGTTPDAPRQGLADAVSRFQHMSGGDTVAFCRGGAWTGAAGALSNPSCSAASPCTLRDYTPEGLDHPPRPVFFPGSADMFRPSGSGYRFWNLDVRGAGTGRGVTFWITGATDVDVCDVGMSLGDAGVVEQTTNQRITIRNSQIVHMSNQGILAGSNGLVIDANYFFDAGATQGGLYHTIYLQGGVEQGPDGYHDERITNNEIHVGTEASAPCNGTILVFHGRRWGTVIRNNLIRAHEAVGGCYGIGITSGDYPYSSWHRDYVVDRNRLFLNGGGEGIQVNQCADCRVTSNAIVLTGPSGWRGIATGDHPSRAGMTPPEQVTTGTVIQNNSIYTGDRDAWGGVVIAAEGDGYVVQNNATWSASGTCYRSSQPAVQSGNFCAGPTTPAAEVFVDWAQGDLRPTVPGPLVGTGDASSFAPTAIGAVTWSSTDPGTSRSPPIDPGAFVH